MKFKRSRIPQTHQFDPSFEAEFPFTEQPILEDDAVNGAGGFKRIQELIKQNRIPEVKRVIDTNAMLEEMGTTQPGLPTRDYMDSYFGKQLQEDTPEMSQFDDMTPESQLKLAAMLRDKYYPNMDQLTKLSGNPTEITALKGEGDKYSDRDGLNIDSGHDDTVAPKASTIMHELGHRLDYSLEDAEDKAKPGFFSLDRGETAKELNDIYRKNPQYRDLAKQENPNANEMVDSEDGFINPIIPNFADYNYPEGEFNSDFMRNPTDLQDEVAKKHHKNRNYPFDNLVGLIQKGRKGVK